MTKCKSKEKKEKKEKLRNKAKQESKDKSRDSESSGQERDKLVELAQKPTSKKTSVLDILLTYQSSMNIEYNSKLLYFCQQLQKYCFCEFIE